MAFEPKIGFGGKLEIDTAYPDTAAYTDVGHVIDFGMNIDVGDVDVTHQQSATSPPFWGEAIPGKVGVELTFNCNFDPGATEHGATVLGHLGVMRQFKYTFTDGSIWTFVGFYRTPNVSIPNEDKNSADVTIRVSGAPTFAGAAA